jgi:hypothetical protein
MMFSTLTGDASDEAPAEERPTTACVAGERNDGQATWWTSASP